jgi:hypothetical protein
MQVPCSTPTLHKELLHAALMKLHSICVACNGHHQHRNVNLLQVVRTLGYISPFSVGILWEQEVSLSCCCARCL